MLKRLTQQIAVPFLTILGACGGDAQTMSTSETPVAASEELELSAPTKSAPVGREMPAIDDYVETVSCEQARTEIGGYLPRFTDDIAREFQEVCYLARVDGQLLEAGAIYLPADLSSARTSMLESLAEGGLTVSVAPAGPGEDPYPESSDQDAAGGGYVRRPIGDAEAVIHRITADRVGVWTKATSLTGDAIEINLFGHRTPEEMISLAEALLSKTG